MTKTASPWLSVLLVIALLLVAAPLPGVQAESGLTPNGSIYGDGDINIYEIWGYAYPDPTHVPHYCNVEDPAVTLYGKVDGTTLYVAVEEAWCINDNVFGDDILDASYLTSAGWWHPKQNKVLPHTFDDLYGSDMVALELSCIEGGVVAYEWTWQQGYIYDADGDEGNLNDADWRSDAADPNGGGGTPPPGMVSSSSLVYNMLNTSWDVTLEGARECTPKGTCNWMSPDSDIGITGVVTDEIGYTYGGPITYDTHNGWEWPIVYEWSVDLADYCPSMEFEVIYVSAHNSPIKGGSDPLPLSVDLLYFTAEGAKRSVVLSWATTNEANNLGFNLWRANSLDGEKVQINDELIPSQVPPAGGGAVYEYTDTKLKNDTTYYYWLQDVDINGNVGWSEPVDVTTIKPGRNARR